MDSFTNTKMIILWIKYNKYLVKFAKWTKPKLSFISFLFEVILYMNVKIHCGLPCQEALQELKKIASFPKTNEKLEKIVYTNYNSSPHHSFTLFTPKPKSNEWKSETKTMYQHQTYSSSLRIAIDVLQQKLEIRPLPKDWWWVHIHIW